MSSSTTAVEDLPSHATLILDLSPAQWHLSSVLSNEIPLSLADCISQVFIFLNAHLAMKEDNSAAVIGAFPGYSVMLYSSDLSTAREEVSKPEHANSYQPFRAVDATLIERIQDEMTRSSEMENVNDMGLVGALTKALCHINRLKNPPNSVAEVGGPSSNKAEAYPRILILSVSPDLSTAYIPLMNSIFAAQKLKIRIDVCKLYGEDTVFLQQASYLTGGSYLALERRDALLQYLMMCFLPSSQLASTFATPSQDKVDFRAACFCHKKVIDIGFVCSVCLSIFCRPIPVCSTCRAKFPMKSLARLGFGKAPQAANGIARNGVNGSAR